MKREDMSRKAFIKKASTGFLALGMSTWNTSSRHEPLDHSDPDDPLVVLGGTNIRVTRMAYGASRTMNPNLLRYALEKLNFLDTGRSYANGQNEVMVGKAIQPVRDKMVIQSKVRVRLGRTESGGETGIGERIRKDMERSLEESLKALLTDHIDILLLHNPSSEEVLMHDAVLKFFRNAKERGEIRACGFSSHSNPLEMIRASNNYPFYDVIMVPYNHKGSYVHSLSGTYNEWDQSAMEAEMRLARKKGTGIIAMKTCSAGPLKPDENSEPTMTAALRWVLNRPCIDSMAVAMGNFSEIDEDLSIMKV